MVGVGYLFVNFKTYESGTGKNAQSLAKLLATFSADAQIIPVVQAVDLRLVASAVPLDVFAQHMDPISFGSNTGAVLAQAIKQAGAIGTVLNHAENKRDNEFVKLATMRAKEAGLKVMLCAETPKRAKELAAFSPDFIAVEPPELIGGNVSVSTAKPQVISKSVDAIRGVNPKIKVITGAGVKTSVDVAAAMELGCSGVFVASGIVAAKDKEAAIRELIAGFK
ncbi:MAG: triose-phosphate isomerase [archaeon]|nr:triose-phosphate isomerase [archaeon]